MNFKIITLLFLALIIPKLYAQMQTVESTVHFSIGETVVLNSEILQEERTLNIYLPEKYEASKDYPVIYLLDGSANEDFLHVVGLVQFFNLQFHMPETIVVGITNVDRKRDFTFHTDIKELNDAFPTTGSSEKFIAFLEKELQPFVQEKFGTKETTYLIGQSLGGLLASEILLKKPQLFSNYIIVSPSLWWDDESLYKAAPALIEANDYKNISVYLSMGTEGPIMMRDTKGLADYLKSSKKKRLSIYFNPMPEENHATILHNSVYEAFKIFFPYKQYP